MPAPHDPILAAIATRILATTEQEIGRLASGAYGIEKRKQFMRELAALADAVKRYAE